MKNTYMSCFFFLKKSVSDKKAILVMAVTLIVSGFFIFAGSTLAVVSSIDSVTPNGGEFVRGNTDVTWTGNALPDDLVDIYYSTDFSIYTKLTISAIPFSPSVYAWNTVSLSDGQYKIKVKANSNAVERVSLTPFTIDNTPPVTTAEINPLAPDGENGWYVAAPTITLTCADALSGCGNTYYKWNDGAYAAYSGILTAPEGDNTLYYYSEDNAVDKDGAHNAETPKTLEVKLDTILPEVSSYTFNDFAADFHFNPDTASVDITINTNEIVKYPRIYICSISVADLDCNNANAVKYFTTTSYDSTVTKNWDGRNSGGIIVADDSYKIRVHMKDIAGNDIYSVLSPYTMTVDTTLPTITAPAYIIDFEATGPTTPVDLGMPTVHDNLDPNPKVVNDAPSAFPLGLTVVTWTVTDWAGNQATDAQNVTIVDTTPPVIDPHDNITAEATSPEGAVVDYTPPASHDLVDGDLPSECSLASGSTFPLGDTTITCSKTDSHGNSATPVTFIITVQDITPPKIDSHPDVTAEATSHDHTIVTYDLPSAYDLVDGSTSVVCLPVSGSEFVLGDTTVNCSSTDSHGNTGYSLFAVHVVDTTSPTIINTPSDFTVVANESGGAHDVTYTNPTATDLVDVTDPVTCLPASGSTFPLGSTLVTCTAYDLAGNLAVPTSFTITVIPGPIDHLHITASPESLKFGDASVITLTGHDEYHNIVTNNNSTIIVLSADNGGALDETILTLSEGNTSTNLRKDSVGTVHVTAISEGLAPVSVTVEFTEADTSSPFVQETFPASGLSGVPVNVQPYLIFSEPLAAETVTSANIQLKKAGGDAIAATVSMDFLEGRQRVTIAPTSVLDFNTQYYFVVTAGVTDLVGNPAIPTETDYSFTTAQDTTILSVTGIRAIKTYALADGTYENGWSWMFNVTVPTTETELQMKFADWTSSLPNTISVANNVRYFSAQASNGPIVITAANTYGDALLLTGDLDGSQPGRQIEILVEAKIPEGSAGGSYSTSYGIQTN